MLNVKISFDNWIASPLTPEEFIRKYYLTERGKMDCVGMTVKQEDESFIDEGSKNV